MTSFIIRRLLQGVLLILIITTIVFFMMRLLPGDPLTLFIASNELNNLTPEAMLELKRNYGLDKPLVVQYFVWIRDVIFKGDLGTSLQYQENIMRLMIERMPLTFHLGFISFVVGSTLGIFFGTICALRRGKWIDTWFTLLANIGITIPGFWIGVLLIYLFSLKLGWLPSYGYTSPFEDFWLNTRQILMPVFCLSIFSVASLTRQTRSTILEVVQQDYVRTAWAKGLAERVIVMRHILKNALIPVVTIVGMHVRMIFGGSVITETVFNIPGIGRLITQAVFSQDYQVVQTGVLIIAIVVILSNLLVDISYSWLDPRIRYE